MLEHVKVSSTHLLRYSSFGYLCEVDTTAYGSIKITARLLTQPVRLVGCAAVRCTPT